MARILAFLFLILGLLPAAGPARAGEIVGGLSQNRVSLTANFSGSEILIFGAIRHDGAAEEAAPFDVIIVIEGPRQPVAIWRKDRRLGIWMNVESVSMASVPSFYAVATTGPLSQILEPAEDAQYRISAAHAIRATQAVGNVDDPVLFTSALLRIRERAEQYQALDRWVYLDRDILFRANVRLPANLTEGAYTTRMYLVREGAVVHQFRTAIFVRKEGIERWLHQLAYDQPFLYGLLALLIALTAGWGASEAFRYLRH
ncbi:MAG: TIGR02186 family protein [Pararhodobacter sp.]|nr:TIGR02186 family protein [Pararhodobacter sp.]